MRLLFVKIHLIIFEIISLVLFISIFGALFYYSIVYQNYSAMKSDDDIEYINISFSANYSKGTYSDVDIKLFPQNNIPNYLSQNHLNATILYSKSNYQGKTQEDIIKDISDKNPYNIFLFEEPKIAENFKHRLLSLRTETSSFNLTLFALISLFLIFIKITLLKDSYLRLKKIKSSKSDGKNETIINLLSQIYPEHYINNIDGDDRKNLFYNPVLSFLNPINVYYYMLFHLTIVIIIPIIFPNYIEYYITSYLGFMPNMYYSVYYARSLFGNDLLNPKEKNIDLSNFIIHRDISKNQKLFIMHDYLNLNDYVPTNVNPYMMNLLIMCGSIWLAQLFHPFDTKGNVKIVEVDLKKGKLKKFMKIFAIVAVFAIWGYFFGRGLIYQLDMYYLFHRLLANNFQRVLDMKILIYIILFYYHIFFYVVMVLYTYQTFAKNKRYEGKHRINYTWFRI